MTVWTDDELPPAEILKEALELIATTYTRQNLAKLIAQLTKKNKKRCDKLWEQITSNLEKIDEILDAH